MNKNLLALGIAVLLVLAVGLSGCNEQQTGGGDDVISPSYMGGIYGSGPPNYLDGVQELEIHGDYLYVSAYLDYRVTILSVEDNKSNPVFVSSIYVGAVPRKMSISNDGNWLYLGTTRHHAENYGSGSLMIINITDKANPSIAGLLIIDNDGDLVGCAYVESKEICYLTSYSENRLYSVDVSNKANPSIVSYVEVGNGPHGVWANESVAFVLGHFDKTVHTFDVSNPSNMVRLSGFGADALYECSQLYGKHAPTIYVASLYNSILVFNISNPSDIQVTTGIEFGSDIACSIVPNAEETLVYVTRAARGTHAGRLEVYKISKMIDPYVYAMISDSEDVPLGRPSAGALGVIGNYIYVGLWDDDGISVFRFE